jgi:DNA-binding beta-propeller fold protein YncE
VSQFGSFGSADGQLKSPSGLAIDAQGDIWVADKSNNRIQEFSSSGVYLRKFGVSGTQDGQLTAPEGIAVDGVGNIWVSDGSFTRRLQKFTPQGTFIKRIGTSGSGLGQMMTPKGLDIANGKAWVADWQNNRVSVFSEAGDFLFQFGAQGVGDGQFKRPTGVDVDNAGNVWVGEQENNRVQQFGQSGEYITQFGVPGSAEGQFDFSLPLGIAADNEGNLWVTDGGNNRIQKWTQSNSASSLTNEIMVDGNPISSKEAYCLGEYCHASQEWQLDSSTVAVGSHTVLAKATDGLGNVSSKSLVIDIQRDTTKPNLEVLGTLASAPEGWVEQKSYSLAASATDGGHGITLIALKIDGEQIASTSQPCVDGGCNASLFQFRNMSTYDGGAHPAEVIATDGAGNVATKKWMVNVDPEGHISTQESIETLEAVEATSPVNAIGETQGVEGIEGLVPGLEVAEENGNLETIGGHVPGTIALQPDDGATLKLLEESAFANPCLNDSTTPAEEEEEENQGQELEPCYEPINAENSGASPDFDLKPAEITPLAVSSSATANTITDDVAAVAPNTTNHVDTVTRPLFDGLLTFATIRDDSAPESYSWEIQLENEQELKLIDSQHAAVYYAGGYPAMAITAEPAHDATGSDVATSLSISEDHIVTLTVKHHATNYVYPVMAGAGWQGGFRTEIVEGPPDELEEKEIKEEEERIAREQREAEEEGIDFKPTESGEYRYTEGSFGPPMADSSPVPLSATQPAGVRPVARAYNFLECHWTVGQSPGTPPAVKPRMREVAEGCHGGAESYKGTHTVKWAVSMSGVFHYKYGHWVWVNEPPNCQAWGPYRPAIVHCYRSSPNPSNVRLDIVSHLRFRPGGIGLALPFCADFNGVLPIRPSNSRPYYGKIHFKYIRLNDFDDKCPWGNFKDPAGY